MIPSSVTKPSLDYLLYTFSSEVRNGLINCELTAGLDKLKALTPEARWLITSGGDQQELRDVFALRGLDTLFNGGIYGSPDTKEEILSRELSGNSPWRPGLYIGDSMYDHLAASNADLDFIFASKWTEFQEWQDYCHKHSIISIESLSELL